MSAATIAVDDLERLMSAALRRSGATPAMAAATARALAAAEMEGIASHGASRIPQYCGHLKNGRAAGSAVPGVARSSKAACLVDAKQGLAYQACALAVREAIVRAKEFGVAFVAIANSNHFGMAAYHVEAIAGVGQVGFAFSNSHVTYTTSNPCTVAVLVPICCLNGPTWAMRPFHVSASFSVGSCCFITSLKLCSALAKSSRVSKVTNSAAAAV